jgi:hypothetical protein
MTTDIMVALPCRGWHTAAKAVWIRLPTSIWLSYSADPNQMLICVD